MSIDQATPTTPTVPDTDQQPSVADQLRALANFIDANPDVPDLGYCAHGVVISLCGSADPRAALAAFVRAGLAAGLRVTKEFDSERWGGAKIHFGSRVSIEAFAQRAQVCDRVVVGTETVTRQVPDPEALSAVPTVEVTETVEHVEWICRPLLASEQNPVADLDDVAAGRVTVPNLDTSVRIAETALHLDGSAS